MDCRKFAAAMALSLLAACGGGGDKDGDDKGQGGAGGDDGYVRPAGDRLYRGTTLQVSDDGLKIGTLVVVDLDPESESRVAGREGTFIGNLIVGDLVTPVEGELREDGTFTLEGGGTWEGTVHDLQLAVGTFIDVFHGKELGFGSFGLVEDSDGRAHTGCGSVTGSHPGVYALTVSGNDVLAGSMTGQLPTGEEFQATARGTHQSPDGHQPKRAVFEIDGRFREGGSTFHFEADGSFAPDFSDFNGVYSGDAGSGNLRTAASTVCGFSDAPEFYGPNDECPCTVEGKVIPEQGACCAQPEGRLCCIG